MAQSQKSGKTRNFIYIIIKHGELSTTCHHFDNHPVVFAILEKDVNACWFPSFVLTLIYMYT